MTDNSQWQPDDPQEGPPPQGGEQGPLPPTDQWRGQHQQGDPSQPSGQWQGQTPPSGQWQGQQAYQSRPASGDERTWMILAHLSAPIAFIVSAGILSILGPLLIWALRKDESPATRQAAAGAFNFNLTFWLLYLLGWVVGILTLTLGFILVIPFWIVLFLVAAFVHIKGALRAAQGETYTYPFQLKVLS